MSALGSRKARKIERLLEEAAELPVGPEERALLDEAVRLADEAGEEELAYRARMHLTPSAHMAGDTDTMLASFGWCVGKHDADPVRFPIDPGVHVDLLFQYKWMAGRLASNSRFPRERVTALHADMERRYREAGVGQTGVLQSRHDVALLLGDPDAAARFLIERDGLERDDYSHCEACVRSSDATFAQLRGDDAEAIRLWEEILEQGLSCGEEPEFAESEALLPLLRAGRVEEALAAHARSYRAARTNPDGFPIIANHLVFCAVTGNLARGLQLLERHIDGLAHDPFHEANHFSGLAAVGVLLDAVVEAGEGATRVRGSDHPTLEPLLGAADGPRTAGELRDAAWSAAETIAARFDARNGNDWFARTLAGKRALSAQRWEAPFGGESYAPPVVDDAEPADAAGWLTRARRRLFAADLDGVRAAVAAGLALGEGDHDAELHRVLLYAQLESGDDEAARATLGLRTAALRAHGLAEHADLEERLGLLLLGRCTPDDIPTLEAEIERARAAHLPSTVVADLLITIGAARLRAEQPEAALAALDEAEVLLPADDPLLLRHALESERLQALIQLGRADEADALAASRIDDRANAGWPLFSELRLRAQVLGGQGRFDEALGFAERLLAESVAIDVAGLIASSAQLTAMILSDLGRPDEAAARIEFALRHAERAELPTVGLRFNLARIQLEAGQAAAGLENLETVYLEEKATGAAPEAVAETGLHLGHAALANDEPGMAYRAWSEAIDLAEGTEAFGLAAEAGSALGELLLRFGDPDARDVFERALEHGRRVEGFRGMPALLHGMGRARLMGGDEAGFADLDAATAQAEAEDAVWYAANVQDTKGRFLVDAGRLDEGVRVLLASADVLAREGDVMTAAGGEVYAARGLAAADRADEAVAVMASARDRVSVGTAAHTGISLELADLLDGLGRGAEAAQVRASVA